MGRKNHGGRPVLTNKAWVGDGKKHTVVAGGKMAKFTSLDRAKTHASKEAKNRGYNEYIYKPTSGRQKDVKVKRRRR